MIKFFITLYLTFVSAFALTLFLIMVVMMLIVESVETPELSERVFIGTTRLLSQSVQGLDQAQLKIKVEHYKQQFPPLFDLLAINSIPFNDKELKQLHQGKLISKVFKDPEKLKLAEEDEEVTLHYYQLPNSSLTWQINSDFNISINQTLQITIIGNDMIKSMFALVEQGFQQRPITQWASHLNAMQAIQYFPIDLKPLNSLQLDADNLKKLNKGEVINITQHKRLVTFAHRMDNSASVLLFEVAEIPWSLYNMLYIVIITLASCIALPVLLWVWPLWRNLSQLKEAAEKFGTGEYTARVPHSKYSRLASISKAFNAMAERTQRSIDSHKELTSAVSHELRTPVARMRFSLEMLYNNDDKQDQQRHINDINTDIEELDLLLSELLTYARFDRNSGDMNFQSQAILAWFNHSMERLLPLAKQIQLHYHSTQIASEEITEFEPRLMSRVLDNLVQNALRYANSTVQVSLTKEDQTFILSVDDDGLGIAEKDRDKLFDAFSRIDSSRDRRSGGFGLGLAIAKRIIEGHKGTIEVEDSKLGGAKFILRW